jgi:hypothetical protein
LNAAVLAYRHAHPAAILDYHEPYDDGIYWSAGWGWLEHPEEAARAKRRYFPRPATAWPDVGDGSRNSPALLSYDGDVVSERKGSTPGSLIRRAELERRQRERDRQQRDGQGTGR